MKIRFFVILFLIHIKSVVFAANWIQTNGPFGGGANSIVKVDTFLFAGTNNGVYRSGDFGLHWTKCNIGVELFVNEITISGNCIFASTDHGIYRSCDYGNSWLLLFQGTFYGGYKYGNKIFFYGNTSGYIPLNFVTSDNGQTWSVIHGLPNASNYSTRIITANSSGLFLAGNIGRNGIVYMSNDSGNTWIDISGPFTNNLITDMITFGQQIFVSTDAGWIYTTSVHGITWTQQHTGLSIPTIDALAEFAGQLYAAGPASGLYHSVDTGNTWSLIPGLYNDYGTNIFAIDSALIYICGGIYFSFDTANTWTVRNNGIINTAVNCLLETSFGIFAGTNGAGVFKTNNNGADWQSINNGLTSLRVTTMLYDSNLIYVGTNGGGIFVSSDSGFTWNHINAFGAMSILSMIKDGNNLFASNGNVYVSTNGSIMSSVSVPISNNLLLALNCSTIYAYNDSTICYSYDNGATWNMTQHPSHSIRLSAYNSKMFLLELSSGIDVSVDSGASWQPYSTMDLINTIAGRNSDVFGCYAGVFHSYDEGQSWTSISNLALNAAGNYFNAILLSGNDLYLSVPGAGVWKADVSLLLSIDQVNELNISIYPTISTGIFNFKFAEKYNNIISIYNSLGQLVYSINVTDNEFRINLTNQPAGIYHCIINSAYKKSSFKLMKY